MRASGMPLSQFRAAQDYNRGLALPVHWLHLAWIWTFAPIWVWLSSDRHRWWAGPALMSLGGFLVLYPFDGVLHAWARAIPLGGDVEREFEFVGQYGAISSIIIASVIIARGIPHLSRRLLDWYAALVVGAVVIQGAKMLLGRPRPRLYDAETFLGPFGAYPLGREEGVRHAWEVWADISSDLWSMPSSHTAYAVIMSVFLASVFPRLRVLWIVLAVLVGLSRILLGAHWPSDVVVGAGLGYIVAVPAVRGGWGRRVWDARRGGAADRQEQG